MWDERREEGDIEAEENEAVMEEALPEAPEDTRDEAEAEDRAFNEYFNIGNGVLNDNNGAAAEDAPQPNAVNELPDNAADTHLGGGVAINFDELQRRAFYERARRELEEATARFGTVNADRYFANYANVAADYPGAYTVAATNNANGVAIAGQNGMLVGDGTNH
jgi:hypothetical protein